MATTLRVRAVTLTFIKTKQPTGWKALLLLLLLDKFFKGLGQSPLQPGEEAILGAGLFLFFNMSAGSEQKTEPCITSCSNGSVEAGSVPPAGKEPILCHDSLRTHRMAGLKPGAASTLLGTLTLLGLTCALTTIVSSLMAVISASIFSKIAALAFWSLLS